MNGCSPSYLLADDAPCARPSIRLAARRQTTAAALVAAVAALLVVLVLAAPAHAGTTTASTLTKSATDPSTGATATSTETTGKTEPGDTLNWVLQYTNSTGSDASVNLTDPIGANQKYVGGSLQTPPSLAPQYSANGTSGWTAGTPPASAGGVGGTGTVPAGTTTAQSPTFNLSTVSFNTPGGDGYTVLGSRGNIYTVFHHTGPNHNPTTVVYCATLANAVCEGWPSFSTYVNPAGGTPIGTGGPGPYTTAGENGSFIANERLFWPVESTEAVGGTFALGMQCLDLTTRQSCGFVQFDSTTFAPAVGQFAMISTDGIQAADGNYYAFDVNGNMICFNPVTSSSCGVTNVSGGVMAGWIGGSNGNVMTDGPYVFATYEDTAATAYMSCYNTATHSVCGPGFPKALGASKEPGTPPFLAPVLSPSGALVGACAIGTQQCYSPAGAALPVNPYGSIEKMGLPRQNGYGSGLIRGTKFYSGDGTVPVHVQCYDFALWNGAGQVPKCAGFSSPANENNYTVRALANLPGCLAADGDAGVITIFNAETGAPCTTATQKVKLTPQGYYCDGQQGHARSWGAVSLPGLTGGEFAGGTVTLYGADGKPVPGWTDVPLPAGSTSLDISSIPVSGNTATLTAEVNLAGVSNPAAVERSKVQLSWRGDGIQVCFKTIVGPQKCSAAQSIPNEGNAVTSGTNGVSDAPAGDSSGRATLFMEPNPNLSGCEADLKIEKRAGSAKVSPGGQLMYTLVVQNKGPDTATNAVVSDAIPHGLSIVSAQPSQGECKVAGAIDCSLGTILKGGSAQILVTAKADANASGKIKNCATVSAKQADPNTTNNADCAEVQVTTPEPPVQPFDLEVVKKVNHKTAVVGQPLTYTLTVTNKGRDLRQGDPVALRVRNDQRGRQGDDQGRRQAQVDRRQAEEHGQRHRRRHRQQSAEQRPQRQGLRQAGAPPPDQGGGSHAGPGRRPRPLHDPGDQSDRRRSASSRNVRHDARRTRLRELHPEGKARQGQAVLEGQGARSAQEPDVQGHGTRSSCRCLAGQPSDDDDPGHEEGPSCQGEGPRTCGEGTPDACNRLAGRVEKGGAGSVRPRRLNRPLSSCR
jgi:uncharacterized repeat protein (TIGR01451 family)